MFWRPISSAKFSGVHLKHELLGDGSQVQSRENLAPNLEAEILAPLQILGRFGETQQSPRINAHRLADSVER